MKVEQKLLPVITKEYVEQSKFDRWCTFFYDKTNKETYLNRTKSALAVYDTTNYGSAGQIGHENFKKLENWRGVLRNYAEDQGITLPVIFRKAVEKYDKTNNPEWMKIVMRMMGDAEFVEEDKVSRLEVTGKDGGPIQAQVLAGIGFLPKQDDNKENTISKPSENDAASSGSVVVGQSQV